MPGDIAAQDRDLRGDRAGGIAIICCILVAMVLLANHPMVEARDSAGLLQGLVRMQRMDQIVHGGLMGAMGALVVCFAGLATRLGLHRTPVLAGLIAFSIGYGALIGATLTDGFITPAVAVRFVSSSANDVRVARDLLAFCSLAIQILTKAGLVFQSVGILGWSAALLTERGLYRATGVLGLIAGLITIVGIVIINPAMTPHVLIYTLIAQCVWSLAIAALLIFGVKTDARTGASAQS